MSFPFKIIDLSHTLTNETRGWNGRKGFSLTTTLDYNHEVTETKFRVQRIKMNAGIGTHMDAPAHCNPEGHTVAELPLSLLATTCVVIDISSHKENHNYTISKNDLLSFEAHYGTIPSDSCVLFYTGWDTYWSKPKSYRNNHFFPAIGQDALMYLLEQNIAGIGIDTLSPDRPESGFFAHNLLLNANKYILENVANIRHMPPTGGYIMALPLKIEGCTESPLRLVGLIPLES